jgi:hypothetical protein
MNDMEYTINCGANLTKKGKPRKKLIHASVISITQNEEINMSEVNISIQFNLPKASGHPIIKMLLKEDAVVIPSEILIALIRDREYILSL